MFVMSSQTSSSLSLGWLERRLTSTFWRLLRSVLGRCSLPSLSSLGGRHRPTLRLLPQRGIRNYGNTCFLNSVLQAFASTPSLNAYLSEIDPKSLPSLKFNKNLRDCMEALRDPSSASNIDKTAKLIFDQLSRHRKMFGDQNEQDAEECLQALLSMMSIELREAKKAKERKSLLLQSASVPQKVPFEGWCRSTITCLKCHTSRPQKHQTFVDISLSLQQLSMQNTRPDLLECLQQYSFQEMLSDVECLNCSYNELMSDKKTLEDIYLKCASKDIGDIIEKMEYIDENSHQLDKVADDIVAVSRVRTDASKQLRISRLPEVLCLHLSRRFYCSETGRMLKNRFKVKFPKLLDMKQFLDEDATTETASSLLFGGQGPLSQADYHLRAVIVHHGDANSGHYTTYALLEPKPKHKMDKDDADSVDNTEKKWMHFSDENAIEVNEEEVLSSEAYMLFYDKV